MPRKPDLTPEEADEVRDLYAGPGKWTVAGLARSFRVQPSTIRAAIDRKGAYAAKKQPWKPGDPR